MKRASLQELASAHLDVLIVGGGIVGCGIARDAALRGLSVGLVEREDIGAGTTSRSTRLIHGGLRYLELLDFGLVRTDMREREILLRIAPHLVRPLPFLVPMYDWPAWKRDRLRVGMVLYDLLSYDKSLPWHRFFSVKETLDAESGLNPHGLQGAARYYDCQVEFPERLALANAVDAAEHGALIRTYTAVERFCREGNRVVGVEARDLGTDRRVMIGARIVVNATGPWLDRSLAGVEDDREPLLRTTKGVHLVMPSMTRNAILLLARRDSRVFFVVPWFDYSLVGTTDTDYPDDPTGAQVDAADVAYLRHEAARALPGVATAPVYYGMAGVRALVRKEGVNEGRVSRKHAVRDHARRGGPAGLVSVVGGKITAYRDIAEEVADVIVDQLGRRARSHTARVALPGGDAKPDKVVASLQTRGEALGLTEEQIRHLVSLYGSRAREVLVLAERRPGLADRFCEHGPTIRAQATYAALDEAATTLADVLLRRAPIGLAACLGLDCVEVAADVIGQALRWDDARRRREVEAYRRLVAERYAGPTAPGVATATA
ncbi:MAG: glycerol-3-phosphate dehydrogenase [Chloroflexota bacterium]|nr:glycerol-3-phosphate dehydrogenase [Chloroflexota bacterium]